MDIPSFQNARSSEKGVIDEHALESTLFMIELQVLIHACHGLQTPVSVRVHAGTRESRTSWVFAILYCQLTGICVFSLDLTLSTP